MAERLNILIMGATYGSLLAQKLLLAGHDCHLVCLPQEAELINRDGLRTRIPVRGRDGRHGCMRKPPHRRAFVL